ncbi:hypothetical protein CATRI_01580 [Corynebacterium atrinae]|uniref:DUF4956 domain-containing protein n=1 Tax=Corynebacterium atrinae TaxID=1336740 RepID=UPI0025B3F7CC|nr:DUF4956 domain-containing protein [Corynebacterium atrinae]WJY62425.1 hypothetical protein CATRI_01580 [Corynebacterium atrinae]
MTSPAMMIFVDLMAILVLVFGIYFPRHRRSDLAVAFLGVNIGVLAVSQILATSSVGAGLGLGLFGVLSIIRLRSSEISQREVAYYFASLAIGLISGLATVSLLSTTMIALIIAVIAVADTSLVNRRGVQRQQIQLDRAIAQERELRAEIENLTGQQVLTVSVLKLDLVNDLTLVEVGLQPRAHSTTPVENPLREAIDA